MDQFSQWVFFVIAFVLAAFGIRYDKEWWQGDPPGLTGSARSEFITTATRSCIEDQTNYPENDGIPVEVLSQFCSCYTEGMADNLSVDDVTAAAGLTEDEIAVRWKTTIDVALKPCVKEFKKSLRRSGNRHFQK